MQIIGAGFGRTGTASLKVALELLGFGPCYHMFEVFNNPEHVPFWNRATRGERVDFATFFQGWQSTVDWPGCTFYRELLELYPNAKVLLSVRDPERWYESCRNTIYAATHARPPVPASAPTSSADHAPPPIRPDFIRDLLWKRTFNNRFEDRDYAVDVFNRHTAAVREHVPPEQLLIYDVKEGWQPLCTFLGVPVPEDQPFPRLNDTATFLARVAGER